MKPRLVGINMGDIFLSTSVPGPKSKALMDRRRLAVANSPFHATPIFASIAEGVLITDVDGNTFLDFASGIGVNNLGHLAPLVTKAIHAQLNRFMHVGFNVTPNENYVTLSEKLNQLTPGNFPKKTFLANSGAEAVENAIKIARAYTKRQAVICFDHAFHGRTFMAMSLTAKLKPYKYGFAPFCSDIYRASFPYAYRWPTGEDADTVANECFEQLEQTIATQVTPNQVAALIIEPVLGEGGFVPAPKSFLAKLREFCSKYGIVLIADEIQTGFGRTGTLFACEQLNLVPDLILMAKGLGGGLPLSAVTGKAEIMDSPIEGAIGGTYGGNPVACAAALGVLETFAQTEILAHAKTVGKILRERLIAAAEVNPFVGDVRGLGPMQAIEIVNDRKTKEPNPEYTKKITRYCYENGLIILSAGTFGNVVRFLIPLCTRLDQLDEGLKVFEKALKT